MQDAAPPSSGVVPPAAESASFESHVIKEGDAYLADGDLMKVNKIATSELRDYMTVYSQIPLVTRVEEVLRDEHFGTNTVIAEEKGVHVTSSANYIRAVWNSRAGTMKPLPMNTNTKGPQQQQDYEFAHTAKKMKLENGCIEGVSTDVLHDADQTTLTTTSSSVSLPSMNSSPSSAAATATATTLFAPCPTVSTPLMPVKPKSSKKRVFSPRGTGVLREKSSTAEPKYRGKYSNVLMPTCKPDKQMHTTSSLYLSVQDTSNEAQLTALQAWEDYQACWTDLAAYHVHQLKHGVPELARAKKKLAVSRMVEQLEAVEKLEKEMIEMMWDRRQSEQLLMGAMAENVMIDLTNISTRKNQEQSLYWERVRMSQEIEMKRWHEAQALQNMQAESDHQQQTQS